MNHQYKKTEAMLYNVPLLEVEIKNLKLDLDDLLEYNSITGKGNDIRPSSPTYSINSIVESEAIYRVSKMSEDEKKLINEINYKERKLKRIQNVLCALKEVDRLLVELKYFKCYTYRELSAHLHISERNVIRMTKRIINTLIPLL